MASSNEAHTQIKQMRNHDIFYYKFMNNGSSSLAVDGSSTPVMFKLEDIPVTDFILNKIDFLISTDDSIDITNFGDVPSLTNGILFNIDGQQILRSNGDVLLLGTDTSIHSVKIQGSTTSIINGHWNLVETFQNGVVCNKVDLYIEIRDDLTSLDFFEVSASGIKLGV